MRTIYELRGFMRRQTLSALVLALVMIYGFWELWSGAGRGDTTALIFGAIFVGGAAYGLRQVAGETRDHVARLEADGSGATVATLWSPLGARRLAAASPLSGWRRHVHIGARGLRRPFLYVDHPAHPRPLKIELRSDVAITDELRALAGEALAEDDAGPDPQV